MEDVKDKVAFDDTNALTPGIKKLNLVRHAVHGDGSCLYHPVAHQAGLITKTSCGNKVVSNNLRQLTYKMMIEHPRRRYVSNTVARKETTCDGSS